MLLYITEFMLVCCIYHFHVLAVSPCNVYIVTLCFQYLYNICIIINLIIIDTSDMFARMGLLVITFIHVSSYLVILRNLCL